MTWKNRSQHAEAMMNNSVGYMRIMPDPLLYKTANGIINPQRRSRVVSWLISTIQKKVEPARIVVSFPGNLWMGITLKRPLEADERQMDPRRDEWETSSQAVSFLEWLGSQEIVLYSGETDDDVSVMSGMTVPFSYLLERWAPTDPDSVSMGNIRGIPDEGGFKMPR